MFRNYWGNPFKARQVFLHYCHYLQRGSKLRRFFRPELEERIQAFELSKVIYWFHRVHEIPPWGWNQDPRLEGITKEQFDYLRDIDEEPKEVPEIFK